MTKPHSRPWPNRLLPPVCDDLWMTYLALWPIDVTLSSNFVRARLTGSQPTHLKTQDKTARAYKFIIHWWYRILIIIHMIDSIISYKTFTDLRPQSHSTSRGHTGHTDRSCVGWNPDVFPICTLFYISTLLEYHTSSGSFNSRRLFSPHRSAVKTIKHHDTADYLWRRPCCFSRGYVDELSWAELSGASR